jgi:protein-tyrosine phosphatase
MRLDCNRVGSKLWVGGFTMLDGSCKEFGLVVLAAYELQDAPAVTVPKLYVPIDDAVLSLDEKARTFEAAKVVAEYRARGQRVLVTCLQGRNRSALIAAQALMLAGLTADEAIARCRNNRKPMVGGKVLSNPNFVKHLQELQTHRSAPRQSEQPSPV